MPTGMAVLCNPCHTHTIEDLCPLHYGGSSVMCMILLLFNLRTFLLKGTFMRI